MRSSTTGFDLPDFDLRAAVDGLRHAFETRVGGFMSAGGGGSRDIRAAILTELATEPMHGYQLIQAIEARTQGAWTPKPGLVYPTLQLLADEGLVSSKTTGERKVYTLTDAGKEAAAGFTDDAASAQHPSDARRGWDERAALPKAGMKLAQAAAQVAQHGTTEQQERAAAIVDEARRKLYAILAEE